MKLVVGNTNKVTLTSLQGSTGNVINGATVTLAVRNDRGTLIGSTSMTNSSTSGGYEVVLSSTLALKPFSYYRLDIVATASSDSSVYARKVWREATPAT